MTAHAIIRKAKERKLNAVVIITMLAGFAIFVVDYTTFDFAERGMARDAVLDTVGLPLLIALAIFWIYAFIKIIRLRIRTRTRFSHPIANIFSVLLYTVMTFIFSIIFISSALVILNTVLGNGKEIMVQAKVENFTRERSSRRNTPEHWYVRVKDNYTGRTLKVEVDKLYAVGDPFSGKFKVGKFGWLYSR